LAAKQKMEIVVNRKFINLLAAIIAGLIVLSITSQVLLHFLGPYKLLWHFDRLFNLNKEFNVPTLFSSLMLFFSAALLTLIAFYNKKSRYFLYWLGLAAIFLFLSVDEGAQIHESIIKATRGQFNASGPFRSSWVIPYAIFVVTVFVVYLKFLFHLPTRIRWLLLLAGSIYVAGAMGLEMIAANDWEQTKKIDAFTVTLETVEETLEMTGILILIYALLAYLETEVGGFIVKVTSLAQAPATDAFLSIQSVSASKRNGSPSAG
jgi:hypothetical protein